MCNVQLVFIRVRWIFSSSDTAEISLNMGRKTLKPLKQGQSHNIATRTKQVIWYHSFYNLQLQGHDHWRNWRIVLAVSVKVWFWMKLSFLYSLTSTYCLILWYLQCHVLALIVVWCFITTIRSYLHFEAPNKSTVALAFAEFYINYTARYAWALVPWLLIAKLRPWLPLHLTQMPLLGQVTILWLSHLVTL